MRQIRLFTTALATSFSLLVFSVSATAGHEQRPLEAAIKAENARWADAFARGDYEAIGRLYTKEGALLPPGGSKIIGASAITEFLAKGFGGAEPDTVTFSNYEFYGDNQTVTEVSDSELRDHSGKLKSRGKQILIFLKQGGEWKLHRDIWNDYPL